MTRPTKLAMRHHLIALAGRIGVRSALRGLHRRCFGPNGGRASLEVAGLKAKFYVHSQAALEVLESLDGERPVLEMLIRLTRPGDCVYDIGAAIGTYAVFLARAVGSQGRVVCFEPEDHCNERLKEHLRLNKLTNVNTFELAVGDAEQEACLVAGLVAGEANLFEGRAPASALSKSSHRRVETVRIVHGDTFVESRKLPVPRLVKIDVNGYEYQVIQGLARTLSLPECEIVCCEIHPYALPPGVTAERLIERLKELGFVYTQLCDRHKDVFAIASKAPILKTV